MCLKSRKLAIIRNGLGLGYLERVAAVVKEVDSFDCVPRAICEYTANQTYTRRRAVQHRDTDGDAENKTVAAPPLRPWYTRFAPRPENMPQYLTLLRALNLDQTNSFHLLRPAMYGIHKAERSDCLSQYNKCNGTYSEAFMDTVNNMDGGIIGALGRIGEVMGTNGGGGGGSSSAFDLFSAAGLGEVPSSASSGSNPFGLSAPSSGNFLTRGVNAIRGAIGTRERPRPIGGTPTLQDLVLDSDELDPSLFDFESRRQNQLKASRVVGHRIPNRLDPDHFNAIDGADASIAQASTNQYRGPPRAAFAPPSQAARASWIQPNTQTVPQNIQHVSIPETVKIEAWRFLNGPPNSVPPRVFYNNKVFPARSLNTQATVLQTPTNPLVLSASPSSGQARASASPSPLTQPTIPKMATTHLIPGTRPLSGKARALASPSPLLPPTNIQTATQPLIQGVRPMPGEARAPAPPIVSQQRARALSSAQPIVPQAHPISAIKPTANLQAPTGKVLFRD
ncbi:hypothetical protein QYM36_013094 [Artemia franciscana]|uniref:Uncharacterized protein n=1 Tax=Artemia franciscana TaxID=6661 RepID=A0AA88HHW6_ARTSF|nr:hypothetical protein QYM36_013094 [Artemia franciscana]